MLLFVTTTFSQNLCFIIILLDFYFEISEKIVVIIRQNLCHWIFRNICGKLLAAPNLLMKVPCLIFFFYQKWIICQNFQSFLVAFNHVCFRKNIHYTIFERKCNHVLFCKSIFLGTAFYCFHFVSKAEVMFCLTWTTDWLRQGGRHAPLWPTIDWTKLFSIESFYF